MLHTSSDVSIWKYKANGEEIITDTAKVTGISAILLRYFNLLGLHPQQ
jgi:UDP-glucose 4-epimerase